MSSRLTIKTYLKKDEFYHFAKLEIGLIQKKSRHDHDFSELFWIESGQGIHWLAGEKRPIRAATLIFVRPDDFHTVGAGRAEEKIVICNLAFPTRIWREVARRHATWGADWFGRGDAARREHSLSAAAFAFLRQAGPELAAAPRSRLMLERFFLNLWVALRETGPAPHPRAPVWLAEAVRRVEREGLFREGPPALTRLSARSQEHVVRECQRWLRKTPTALINEMRMRHAATRLSATQSEIIDICYDCGIENVGHFYTLFQKFHGMTPRQYRLRSQSIVRPER
jgi:AraC family cel operon transcriptional repressor